jgi:hypothetical protein
MEGAMKLPTRFYTAIAGIFLLIQGISTLVFRLIPSLDRAFPQLLGITKMIPAHSMLHIVTGLLALVIFFRVGARGTFWFASGFGIFYTGLALHGYLISSPTIFGLQTFDHPIHLFLGIWGLIAAGMEKFQNK